MSRELKDPLSLDVCISSSGAASRHETTGPEASVKMGRITNRFSRPASPAAERDVMRTTEEPRTHKAGSEHDPRPAPARSSATKTGQRVPTHRLILRSLGARWSRLTPD